MKRIATLGAVTAVTAGEAATPTVGSVNLASYIGKTVTVAFLGVEDASLATNFCIVDTS